MKKKAEHAEEYQRVSHEFPPVYNAESRILILGSFPSVKSREQQFYYGHPQNRFWKVLASLLDVPVPQTIKEKKQMLLEHKIAVWDVIESCEIIGSSDSSIRNVVPNQLEQILNCAKIEEIYTNGGTAKKLFDQFQQKSCGRTAVRLPSTSPANAAYSLERLISEWRIIL